MVMAGKSDAASMSAASNRPSTAQRRRFSRSIASRAPEASSPASPASSASLSGKSIVSVAIIRVSPARCSNTGLDHLRPGGSQTMFDSPARSEIPTRIACRTKLAHTPVPVSEDGDRTSMEPPPTTSAPTSLLALNSRHASRTGRSHARRTRPHAWLRRCRSPFSSGPCPGTHRRAGRRPCCDRRQEVGGACPGHREPGRARCVRTKSPARTATTPRSWSDRRAARGPASFSWGVAIPRGAH